MSNAGRLSSLFKRLRYLDKATRSTLSSSIVVTKGRSGVDALPATLQQQAAALSSRLSRASIMQQAQQQLPCQRLCTTRAPPASLFARRQRSNSAVGLQAGRTWLPSCWPAAAVNRVVLQPCISSQVSMGMQHRALSTQSHERWSPMCRPYQHQHQQGFKHGPPHAALSAAHASGLFRNSDDEHFNHPHSVTTSNSARAHPLWSSGFHSSSSSSSTGKKQAAAATAAHGSSATALGMSSYEIAAEKMSDREILSTLAHHLWPKGKLTWTHKPITELAMSTLREDSFQLENLIAFPM